MNAVKSTINIDANLKTQLDDMVRNKYAESFTSAVNQAIAMYIKSVQRELYAKQMEEAARDEDFIARTNASQEAFEYVDAEDSGEW